MKTTLATILITLALVLIGCGPSAKYQYQDAKELAYQDALDTARRADVILKAKADADAKALKAKADAEPVQAAQAAPSPYDDPQDYCGLVSLVVVRGEKTVAENERGVLLAQRYDTSGALSSGFAALRQTIAQMRVYQALMSSAACDQKITLAERKVEAHKFEAEWEDSAQRFNVIKAEMLRETQ